MIRKEAILERLDQSTVIQLMDSFGAQTFQPKTHKPNELWFKTVCHGGNSHKLCYYINSKLFYCYSECGSMNVFSLVMQIKNCSFTESVQYLARLIGLDERRGFHTNISSILSLDSLHNYAALRQRKEKEVTVLQVYNESVLDYFESDVYCGSWIDEGISSETMRIFNIRWYELNSSVIIPHYNMDHQLIGIRRRSFQEEDLLAKRKYMPLYLEGTGYAHPLGLNLYGLDLMRDSISKKKSVILVESEKSVMLSYEYYGLDSITLATCGFNITNWQRDAILSLGINEVILGFDKDYDPVDYENYDPAAAETQDYKRFVDRILSLAYKFTAFCNVYVLWDEDRLLHLKDSPFDRGKDIFERLMQSKQQIFVPRERSE